MKMRCNRLIGLAICMLPVLFATAYPTGNLHHGTPRIVTSTWNGTTWSAGTPNSTIDALIASSTAPAAFTCLTLTVNSGVALTINAGVTIQVQGNLTNDGNGLAGMGTIQFNKSGSTVQLLGNAISFEGIVDVLTGTTLNTNGLLTLNASTTTSYGRITGSTGTITGNVTVKKVLANTNTGFRHISLPVDAPVTSLTGFDLLTSSHSPSYQQNVFYWNAAISSGTAATGWSVAAGTDDETKAFSIYSNNSATGLFDVSSPISITGVPNQSNYTISLTYSHDPRGNLMSSTQRGWNFIPNRFPSNIDVSVLINDANFGTTYKAVHVYSEVTGQYFGINQSTLINYQASGGSLSTLTNDIIPFQGFWVKATSTSQSIQVKNSHRSTDLSTSAVFTRKSVDQLRLNVSDTLGWGDQVAVLFDEKATEQLDGTMDLYKLKSPSKKVPTLYCQEGELELCTNALPLLKNERNIQLMFESEQPGLTYTISPDFSSFNPENTVSIEDRKTGVIHNLSKGAYQFTYDDKFGKDRFVLHISRNNTAATKNAKTTEQTVVLNVNSK